VGQLLGEASWAEDLSLVERGPGLLGLLFACRSPTFFGRQIGFLLLHILHLGSFVLPWKAFLLVLMHFLFRPLILQIGLELLALQF